MQRPRAGVRDGTVLIRSGTEAIREVHIVTLAYSRDWETVEDGDNLDARLRASGWSLFFIAGSLRATCLGSGDTSLRRGIIRLLKQVRALNLNALRVTHIRSKEFLGIPYRTLVAQPCHVQQGYLLSTEDNRKKSITHGTLQLTQEHAVAFPDVEASEGN